MKKITKLLSAIVLMSILFTACSKDNKVSRKLDGDWTVTEFKVNGDAQDLSAFDIEYSFTECDTKEEYCSGSITFSGGNFTDTELFEYQISEKGKVMTIRDDPNDTDLVVANIIDVDNNDLEISYTDDDDFFEITMEKK